MNWAKHARSGYMNMEGNLKIKVFDFVYKISIPSLRSLPGNKKIQEFFEISTYKTDNLGLFWGAILYIFEEKILYSC